jgi:2-keto-3-deoxy-L-rhamnonate aldolase RhmA
MRQNRVKKLIREGKLAIGTFVELADPQMVEIIGLAGYDAAFIDMEHSNFDLPLVGEMIRSADLVGITSIVRVPGDDTGSILRLLDMGAEGLFIPHVEGIEGAKRAVEEVRYAPLGRRGAAGGSRAARFGTVSWEEHTRQSNEEILLVVMTEDAKGIDDIEKIAALDGIDLVAIGPMDFSEYMGIRDPNDPRLKNRLKELSDQVKKIGKAKLALPVNNQSIPLTPQELLDLGVGYSNVSPAPPALLVQSMTKTVENIHQATGRA